MFHSGLILHFIDSLNADYCPAIGQVTLIRKRRALVSNFPDSVTLHPGYVYWNIRVKLGNRLRFNTTRDHLFNAMYSC